MVHFVYHKSAEHRIMKSPGGMVDSHISDLADRVEFMAKLQVGVDTGDLRESIHVIPNRQASGMPSYLIGSSNSIAYLHHEGSRPHIIKPKEAKVLRFAGYGTIVYACLLYTSPSPRDS